MKGISTIAVAVLAMAAIRVKMAWDLKEGRFHNWFTILQGPNSVGPLFGTKWSLQEQVAYLDSLTKRFEHPLPMMGYFLSEKITSASFGPNATHVVEFSIPSRDEGRNIPALCARSHTTDEKPLPLILYYHFGGLVMGSPRAEKTLIRYLAQEANAVVCAIQYRKAPLYPYPAATNDAVDSALYLLGAKKELIESILGDGVFIDNSKVATFGSSSGGYLAGIVPRLLAAENVSIQLQVSLVPMIKPHGGTESIRKFGKGDFWNREWNFYAWTVYLPEDDGTLANDWRVNLLTSPPPEIAAKLPPVYLEIHQRDILHDEGLMYAERIENARLLELVTLDTNHVGGLPPFSNGGPADGSFQRTAEFVGSFLHGQ